MSQPEADKLDKQLSGALRLIRLGQRLPEPTPEEPADDELLLLIEEKLPEAERQRVEALLARCPYSADRVDVLRQALADFASRTRLSPDTERAPERSRFARLVFTVARGAEQAMAWLCGTDVPLPVAAAAMPTRGAATGRDEAGHYFRFERRFGDCDAVIQVERVPHRGVELRLDLTRQGARLEDARAVLRCRGKLVESVRVRDGTAGFVGLQPDCYQIQVTGKDEEIGRLAVDLLSA